MRLTDIDFVKGLKQNLHTVFDTPAGKDVMEFLELYCGWYESVYDPVTRDMVMINAGRREVIATIKTILKFSPEQITEMVKAKEE